MYRTKLVYPDQNDPDAGGQVARYRRRHAAEALSASVGTQSVAIALIYMLCAGTCSLPGVQSMY